MLRYKLAKPLLWTHRLMGPLRRGASTPSFRVLLLHDIPRDSLRAFERLVLHIKDRYGLISPEQAQDWLDGRVPPQFTGPGARSPFLLTFDDGFLSNFEAARWMLDRHHVKAVFFICPGLMDLAEEAQRKAIAAQYFRRSDQP